MPAGPTLRTVAPVFSRGGSQAGSTLVLRRPFPSVLLVYVMATPMAWPLRFQPGQNVAALIVAGLASTGGTRIERVGRTVAVMR